MKSKKSTSKYKILIIIGGAVLVLFIIFFAVANLIVFRNDCGSACDFDPNNPYTTCADVCVKTEQSLWEQLTGQKPRKIGY